MHHFTHDRNLINYLSDWKSIRIFDINQYCSQRIAQLNSLFLKLFEPLWINNRLKKFETKKHIYSETVTVKCLWNIQKLRATISAIVWELNFFSICSFQSSNITVEMCYDLFTAFWGLIPSLQPRNFQFSEFNTISAIWVQYHPIDFNIIHLSPILTIWAQLWQQKSTEILLEQA